MSKQATCLATTPIPQDIQWWHDRHREKILQREAMLNDVKLVFLGDSITQAWDDKGHDVWQQHYKPRQALNLGFNGDRTEHVLWRLDNGAIEHIRPKLIVLLIGTNNAGHRKEAPAETALGISHIIQKLRTKLPTAKILLLAIFPRGPDNNDPLRRLVTQINQLIQSYTDNQHVFWLDINAKFLDNECRIDKQIMEDYLHPNPEQYKVWAEAIEATLCRLLDEHSLIP
jgi:lysophospholipase L1-like esterase